MTKLPTTPTNAIEKVYHTTIAGIRHMVFHGHTIGFILHGSLCTHSEHPQCISQGEIYLLKAGWHYVEYLSHDSHPYEEIVVRLAPNLIKSILRDVAVPAATKTCDKVTICAQPSTQTLNLFYKGIEYYLSQRIFLSDQAMERIKIEELIHLLINQRPTSPIALNIAQLAENDRTYFNTLVHSDCFHKQTIAQLAQRCGMGVSTFKAVFKKEFGCTPHNWLLTQRLETICTLLRCTNEPIKNIAQECGFSTPSHMIRVFRATYGVTPTQFRSKHRH